MGRTSRSGTCILIMITMIIITITRSIVIVVAIVIAIVIAAIIVLHSDAYDEFLTPFSPSLIDRSLSLSLVLHK